MLGIGKNARTRSLEEKYELIDVRGKGFINIDDLKELN